MTFTLILKLDSKSSVISDGTTPTKIVFRRPWSFPAALESVGFFILMLSATFLILLMSSNGNPFSSPELSAAVIFVGGGVSAVLSWRVYSASTEKYFISSVGKRYGYVVEDFGNSIIEENPARNESRMLLPMSSIMPSSSDIYIVRTKRGAFVEEVRS